MLSQFDLVLSPVVDFDMLHGLGLSVFNWHVVLELDVSDGFLDGAELACHVWLFQRVCFWPRDCLLLLHKNAWCKALCLLKNA